MRCKMLTTGKNAISFILCVAFQAFVSAILRFISFQSGEP